MIRWSRVQLSPAYQLIRRNITRTRCVEPPALYDWASDPDLRGDLLERAGLGATEELTPVRLPSPVPFRAYPGTSSERGT